MRHPRNALILCALYVFFIGCQSTKESSYIASDISSYRDKKITAVTLKNGEIYRYDKVGGRYIEEKRDSATLKQIVGFDPLGAALNFELSKILEVQGQTVESDSGATIGTVLLIAGGVIVAAYLLLALLFSGFSRL